MPSWGNWSQYCILKEDKNLREHLLNTEIFTEESLYTFLNLYGDLLLKPCFGHGNTFVYSIEDECYKVISHHESVLINGKRKVFDYLRQHVCKGQYYLLLPINSFDISKGSIIDYTITIHQETASKKWKVVTKVPYKKIQTLDLLQQFLLNDICKQIGERLETIFPEFQTILIDVGYDRDGNVWIVHTDPQFSSSKWNQYQQCNKLEGIEAYLPATQIVTPYSFYEYLILFQQIILKPCLGQWGKGVIQVTHLKDDCYEVQVKRKKTIFENQYTAFQYLETNFFSKKRYIVQEKILLAQIDGNPFDMRIMAQRGSITSTWKITGGLIKIASNGFITTNIAKSLLSLDEGLRIKDITDIEKKRILNEINRICLLTAVHLGNMDEELYCLGYDIGMTENGQIFIIEVNFTPDISMFKALKDQTIYSTIVSERKSFRRNR